MEKRVISGFIDEFGFPYLKVDIIDPISRSVIQEQKAIIDTGAAYSHMKKHIVEILRLDSIDSTKIKHLTDGEIDSDVYRIHIKLNEKYMISDTKIRIITQEQYPSDLIIGIDILKHCDFSYNTIKKSFVFTLFPNILDPE